MINTRCTMRQIPFLGDQLFGHAQDAQGPSPRDAGHITRALSSHKYWKSYSDYTLKLEAVPQAMAAAEGRTPRQTLPFPSNPRLRAWCLLRQQYGRAKMALCEGGCGCGDGLLPRRPCAPSPCLNWFAAPAATDAAALPQLIGS